MKKFSAIEGLRGWLAWTVVLDHLVEVTNSKGVGHGFIMAGHYAVLIFIIISGFVITHLVSEKPEPYRLYILRRFMRIFPLFAVTCVLGYFTSDILAHALTKVSWAADPFFIDNRIAIFSGIARTDHAFFWQNLLAHLLMLHGAIGDNILPFSQYAFNSPAWSLSLEWQFYLIAPFAILLASRPRSLVRAALVIAILEIAYAFDLFGSFHAPSFLPGAAGYFALGIASRLAYPALAGTVRQPSAIVALFMVLIPFGWDAVPLLVWALVMTGLILNRSAPDSFAHYYRLALESRWAMYFGSRSFSVYLCHLPMIAICLSLWLSKFPASGRYMTFFALSATAVPLTIAAAELLYRCIERPGIALGSRLAQRAKNRSIMDGVQT
jgi:peptidoglycan/LPS O-acetylase OafA/YrhL